MLLDQMRIPHDTPEQLRKWIKYTRDRHFNDRRYAVDGTKLKRLGWEQKVSIDEGLKITVDWFTQFGESWWGDISHVLTPFPTVADGEMVPDDARSMRDEPHESQEIRQGRLPEQQGEKDVNGCREVKQNGDDTTNRLHQSSNGVYQIAA
jgi:dTDP-glucose 4,6-dehydratase